jgi:hypothetical protein
MHYKQAVGGLLPSIWTLPFYEWLAKGAIADDPLDFDEHRFK